MGSNSSKKEIASWYGRALLIFILIAVAWYIRANLREIVKHEFSFNYRYLAASFAIMLAAHLSMVIIWKDVAASYGLKAPFKKTAKAFFLSQLGKYLPGKLGIFLVRFSVYREHSKRKIAVATSVEYISLFTATFFLVIIGLAFAPKRTPDWIRWMSGAGILAFLVILWPPFFQKAINGGLKILKKPPLREFPPYRKTIKYITAYLFTGLLFGLSLHLSLSAVDPVPFQYFITITGTFFAAILAGIAAVFAPSGIGVREGVLFMILPAFMPKPTVIIGAILSRLVMTASELLLALFFSILDKPKNAGEKKTAD